MTSIVAPALDGLVLLGGKSSRMGQTKALLEWQKIPMWQRAMGALQGTVRDVFFSISPNVTDRIPIASDRLIHDVFNEPFGPLSGILSAFKQKPESAFFVLACDLPNFNEEAAHYVQKRRNPHKYATVFTDQNGTTEPLMGIYEPKIARPLALAWLNNRYCPRKILEGLDIERVVAPHPQWFVNLNYPSDYLTLTHPETSEKTITVRYFASLKDKTKMAQEIVTTKARTITELFAEVAHRHQLEHDTKTLLVAKNNDMTSFDDTVQECDDIAFMPPVSGG